MKYVLVTGAAGGMGRATVLHMRSLGYTVFALDKTACEREEGVIPLSADLTVREEIKAAFDTVASLTDRLDTIVHFAGIYLLDSFVEIEEEKLKRAFDINLFGAMEVNRIFLPLMKKGSRIVITTSELAPLDPLPFTGIYAVTKASLDRYAFSLAMELQLLGITVSVLRAGAVDTGMLGVSTAALERFCESTALYTCNADRFRNIVNRVEARSIKPLRVAEKVGKILHCRKPRFVYAINRNPLLLLLHLLPKGLQLKIIHAILR